jgi:hypothetical protein
MNRRITIVVSLIALLALSATSGFAWEYLEDFDNGPGGPVSDQSDITDCGWVAVNPAAMMSVEKNHHVPSAWTGNCARGKTSAQNGEYYESLGPGVPSTGILRFTCKAWSTNPYVGGNWYYGNGSVGIGGTAGANLANWWGGADNRDLWVFDARGIGATYYFTTKMGFRDVYEMDQTVQLCIVVDQTNKLVWGVIDNGKGVREETPHMSYTDAIPIGSVRLTETSYDWKDYGVDADDIRVSDDGTVGGTLELADYKGDLSVAPVKIHLVPTAGGAEKTVTVTLTPDSATYLISDVPNGTYTISYSSCKCKTLVRTGVVVSGGADVVENAVLVNGNMNGTGSVDGSDVGVVLKNLE